MPVNVKGLQNQAASIIQTQKFIQELESSLKPASEGGKALTGAEAQRLVGQASQLPANELKDLKAAVLDALQAKDHWQCTPDARSAFADFLGVPPDKLPAPVELRPEMGAMFTKAHNEAGPARIPRKEFTEVMDGAKEHLPPDLREMVTASVLGMHKEGQLKLDPQSRRRLTKDVAEVFGDKGPDDALRLREESDLKVSSAQSYLHQVIASGGSFEEIIFALLLLLGEKAEKKALDMMDELNKQDVEDEAKKGGPPGQPGAPTGPGRPGAPVAPDKPGGTPPESPLKQGDVKNLAKNLEGIVQSAHHMVKETSDGGNKITVREAGRLTEYLRKLPEDVQGLLAGSIQKAVQAGGVPITANAHYALEEWGKEAAGPEFSLDLSAYEPGKPTQPSSELAKKFKSSEKLEDRIAGFLVETLYQPEVSLKEKVGVFKALGAAMPETEGAPKAKASFEQTAQEVMKEAAKGNKSAAEPAADAKIEPQGEPEASAGRPTVEQTREMMAAALGPEQFAQMEEALGPEKMNAMIKQAADQVEANGGDMPPMPPEGPGGAPPLDADGEPIKKFSARVDDGSVPSDTRFDERGGRTRGPGRGGKKRKSSTAQHELQMAMNERQRTFDMLSNIMKAMHDTMMTSIRNIR